MQINIVVGEGLGPPAVAINLNLLLRDVEAGEAVERRPLRPQNRLKSFYGNRLANVQIRRGRRLRRPVNERFEPNIAGGASND